MSQEKNVLKAVSREAGSKGQARSVRRDGLIPAIVYGHGVNDLVVAVDPKEFEAALRTEYAYNAVFDLAVEGGATHQVMVRELQFNSVKRTVTHVDFKVVQDNDVVVVAIPVVADGRSVGVAQGGRLDIVKREVKVRTTVANIPVDVTYDVTNLDIGEQVYIDEMTAPEGASFVYNNRYPVIRVVRRRGAKAATTEEA